MKYLIFTIFFIAGSNAVVFSQNLRHVQGISLIGISCGTAPGAGGTTLLFGADYSRYLRKNWILNIGGRYETGNVETTRARNYLLDAGADCTLLKAGNFLFLNAGLSVRMGGETLESAEGAGKKNSFVAGPAGNINVEAYLADRVVLQLRAEQNYLPGSVLGNWYPVFTAGLKFCIF